MRKLIFQLTVVFLFFCKLVFGQDKSERGSEFISDVSNVGTSTAAFLEIGIGARPMGMGGAYTAQAGYVEGLYWNPAGVASITNFQASFSHTEWLAETQFDFVGLVIPLSALNSCFGLSFITLGYDEQPVRTIDQPQGTGEFYDARDFAVGVTIASSLTNRFSFGLTGKYISQRIWSEDGNTYALDAGVFYRTQLSGLTLGASISNFGTEILLQGRNLRTTVDPDERITNYDRVPVEFKTSAYPLPLLFRFGVAYKVNAPMKSSISIVADLLHPNNTTESINLGVEYEFNNLFFLRSGYQSLFERDGISSFTYGAGLKYTLIGGAEFILDYSYSDWDILGNVQRISINFKI
jgi:hypothetical protein